MLTLDGGWEVRKLGQSAGGQWYAMVARWFQSKMQYAIIHFTDDEIEGSFPYGDMEAAFWAFKKSVS